METICYKKIKNNNRELKLNFNIYRSSTNLKGVILYFHGGGFIYGGRDDLPELHKDVLTSNGYTILSFDYRLAPESPFKDILQDAKDGVNFFLENRDSLELSDVPFFFWGRSAGAYLSLLLSTIKFNVSPNAVVSFYGYGFTVDSWFDTPSKFYLEYPNVKEEDVDLALEDYYIKDGDIFKRLLIYIYGRQTGTWVDMISEGYREQFLNKYSLKRIQKDLPRTFFAYSFKDTDVPYLESIKLKKIFKNSETFATSADGHDFDRDEKSDVTIKLLNKTLEFLNSNL